MKKLILACLATGLCVLLGTGSTLWAQGSSKAISLPKRSVKASTAVKKTPSKKVAKKSVSTAVKYQSLVDWGKKNGFRAYWVKKGKIMRLTKSGFSAEFEVNKQCVLMNGVRVWIGHPIQMVSGRLCMDAQDIQTSLAAVATPKKRKAVKTVVIDPGHGGAHPGAAVSGKKEKDYVLLIAKEVKRLLESKGLKVVLTRSGDQTLGLSERPAIATRAKADLFVSIHLNAATSKTASGVEVFTTTPAGDQSTNPDRSGSREKTAGNDYDAYNVLLAYYIQKELVDEVDFEDRGVRRDRLAVLHSTKVPAVLVEAGFITSAVDQKKIFYKTQRDRSAKAIADGILNYKEAVEKGTAPSPRTTVQKL